MRLVHESAGGKERRSMIGVEAPGAVVEQVVNHLMRERDIAPYLVHDDEGRVSEVPADIRVQAVPWHNDNERRWRGSDASAGRNRPGVALKIAGGLRRSSWLAQLHSALPGCVGSPAVPVVVVGRHVITTAAATVQQNDQNKNRSSHAAQG